MNNEELLLIPTNGRIIHIIQICFFEELKQICIIRIKILNILHSSLFIRIICFLIKTETNGNNKNSFFHLKYKLNYH